MTKLLLWCILLVVFWPLALVIAAVYAMYLCVMLVVWLYVAAFKGTAVTIVGITQLLEWLNRRQELKSPEHPYTPVDDRTSAHGAYQVADLQAMLKGRK